MDSLVAQPESRNSSCIGSLPLKAKLRRENAAVPADETYIVFQAGCHAEITHRIDKDLRGVENPDNFLLRSADEPRSRHKSDILHIVAMNLRPAELVPGCLARPVPHGVQACRLVRADRDKIVPVWFPRQACYFVEVACWRYDSLPWVINSTSPPAMEAATPAMCDDGCAVFAE